MVVNFLVVQLVLSEWVESEWRLQNELLHLIAKYYITIDRNAVTSLLLAPPTTKESVQEISFAKPVTTDESIFENRF